MINPCLKHSTESQPRAQIHFSLKFHYSRKSPLFSIKSSSMNWTLWCYSPYLTLFLVPWFFLPVAYSPNYCSQPWLILKTVLKCSSFSLYTLQIGVLNPPGVLGWVSGLWTVLKLNVSFCAYGLFSVFSLDCRD